MIKKSEIANFDAFGGFADLLVGETFDFPLRDDTVDHIENKDSYKAITVKSSSLVTADAIKQFPNLELLITRTVGLNHVEVDEIIALGVELKNIPDYGAFSIAEHVFALLLTMTRKVIFLDKEIRSGRFASDGAKGFTLEGKTMGIVGVGRIGKETVKLAKAFKMKVLGYDLYPNEELSKELDFEFVTLDRLLKNSDVVSLNMPLTEHTRHFLNAEKMELMKDNSVLINTSRGAIIDTDALLEKIHKFKYVGLDVLEDEEKFDKDHPLLNMKNVVITPHCAFYTDRSEKKIAEETIKHIENHFTTIKG